MLLSIIMTSEFTASTAVSSCFLTFSTSLNLTSAFCPRRGPPPGHRRLGGPRFRPALSPRGATRRVPGQRAASRAPPPGPCRPASATELLHPAHCPPPPPPPVSEAARLPGGRPNKAPTSSDRSELASLYTAPTPCRHTPHPSRPRQAPDPVPDRGAGHGRPSEAPDGSRRDHEQIRTREAIENLRLIFGKACLSCRVRLHWSHSRGRTAPGGTRRKRRPAGPATPVRCAAPATGSPRGVTGGVCEAGGGLPQDGPRQFVYRQMPAMPALAGIDVCVWWWW